MKNEALRILDNLITPYGLLVTGSIRSDLPESFCEQLIRQGKAERILHESKAVREAPIETSGPTPRPTPRRSEKG